jgi:hypothetical protein
MATIVRQERSFYPSPVLLEAEEPALLRLAALHAECVETARLAAILARTPLAAYSLVTGCAVLIAFSSPSVSLGTLALWALLVVGGAFGLLRLVHQNERAAFELVPLTAFALDLNAMLLYAGFAWGAGAFLAISPASPALLLEWHAVGAGLVITGVMRAQTPTLCFLVPNAALAVAAALAGGAGASAAALIVFASAVLAASTSWAERRRLRLAELPPLPAFRHS